MAAGLAVGLIVIPTSRLAPPACVVRGIGEDKSIALNSLDYQEDPGDADCPPPASNPGCPPDNTMPPSWNNNPANNPGSILSPLNPQNPQNPMNPNNPLSPMSPLNPMSPMSPNHH